MICNKIPTRKERVFCIHRTSSGRCSCYNDVRYCDHELAEEMNSPVKIDHSTPTQCPYVSSKHLLFGDPDWESAVHYKLALFHPKVVVETVIMFLGDKKIEVDTSLNPSKRKVLASSPLDRYNFSDEVL